MTSKDKIARCELSLLELASELSNVSKACKVMGYSRQHFGEVRRNLQTFGAESRGYGPTTPSRAAAPTTAACQSDSASPAPCARCWSPWLPCRCSPPTTQSVSVMRRSSLSMP